MRQKLADFLYKDTDIEMDMDMDAKMDMENFQEHQ
jgi:hypothetical protein